MIGLLGFVLATLTAQTARLGIQDEGPVFWVGAVFGGVVQVTAGMLSYFQGDNFHFMVYNAFGYYWIVVPGFLAGEQLGFFEVTPTARGFFSLAFAILALAFSPAGAVHNTVLPVTLLFVFAGLLIEAVGSFVESDYLGQIGSWVLIGAALLAAYMLVEKFYWRTMGRRVLPLGPPWVSGNPDPES